MTELNLAQIGTARPASLAGSSLAGVADLMVTLTVVLGEVRLTIGEIAALAPGAVVELDRQAGEPVDVYVNDRLIGRGELVLVDGRIGVTLTELIATS